MLPGLLPAGCGSGQCPVSAAAGRLPEGLPGTPPFAEIALLTSRLGGARPLRPGPGSRCCLRPAGPAGCLAAVVFPRRRGGVRRLLRYLHSQKQNTRFASGHDFGSHNYGVNVFTCRLIKVTF